MSPNFGNYSSGRNGKCCRERGNVRSCQRFRLNHSHCELTPEKLIFPWNSPLTFGMCQCSCSVGQEFQQGKQGLGLFPGNSSSHQLLTRLEKENPFKIQIWGCRSSLGWAGQGFVPIKSVGMWIWGSAGAPGFQLLLHLSGLGLTPDQSHPG